MRTLTTESTAVSSPSKVRRCRTQAASTMASMPCPITSLSAIAVICSTATALCGRFRLRQIHGRKAGIYISALSTNHDLIVVDRSEIRPAGSGAGRRGHYHIRVPTRTTATSRAGHFRRIRATARIAGVKSEFIMSLCEQLMAWAKSTPRRNPSSTAAPPTSTGVHQDLSGRSAHAEGTFTPT